MRLINIAKRELAKGLDEPFAFVADPGADELRSPPLFFLYAALEIHLRPNHEIHATMSCVLLA